MSLFESLKLLLETTVIFLQRTILVSQLRERIFGERARVEVRTGAEDEGRREFTRRGRTLPQRVLS
jgi:hypothetical protein